MLSRPAPAARPKEEGEKPFWISYADLMTAMMMLFLVVMAFSLIIITNPGPELAHEDDVKDLCGEINALAKGFEGVTVDCNNKRIDFGPRATFGNDDYHLTLEAKKTIRRFVPEFLEKVRERDKAMTDSRKKLLKRVVIEGYASKTGTYLHNLQLSMRRAESVLCGLFEPVASDERPLTDEEKREIRRLFLVGGYSFNNVRGKTDEDARRVEFKLEFMGYGETPALVGETHENDFGSCREVAL